MTTKFWVLITYRLLAIVNINYLLIRHRFQLIIDFINPWFIEVHQTMSGVKVLKWKLHWINVAILSVLNIFTFWHRTTEPDCPVWWLNCFDVISVLFRGCIFIQLAMRNFSPFFCGPTHPVSKMTSRCRTVYNLCARVFSFVTGIGKKGDRGM